MEIGFYCAAGPLGDGPSHRLIELIATFSSVPPPQGSLYRPLVSVKSLRMVDGSVGIYVNQPQRARWPASFKAKLNTSVPGFRVGHCYVKAINVEAVAYLFGISVSCPPYGRIPSLPELQCRPSSEYKAVSTLSKGRDAFSGWSFPSGYDSSSCQAQHAYAEDIRFSSSSNHSHLFRPYWNEPEGRRQRQWLPVAQAVTTHLLGPLAPKKH